MTKPLAVSLSLSLLLQPAAVFAAPAAWNDALRGPVFEKAVLTSAPSTEIADGITLSPGVAKILQRVSGSRFTRVADKGDQETATPLVVLQGAMRNLTRKVAPTVVTILAKGKVQAKASPELNELDKLFEELLRRAPKDGPQAKPKTPPKTAPAQPKGQAVPQPKDKPDEEAVATGSGVIVDNRDGKPLVVTNAHVVEISGMNGKVTVFLKDETPGMKGGHEAAILGFNGRYDLALLKFTQPCPTCQAAALGVKTNDKGELVLGNDKKPIYDPVEDGDFVLAVGTPYGLPQTKSFGIVSFDQRDVPGKTLVDDFIQTDAAINRGNSGGPLFNIQGRVIGINTEIFSPNGGSVGIGFAIPVHHVVSLIERYKATGAVAAALLGIQIKETEAGIAIAAVEKGSPQEKAGLAEGDLIVAIDGKPAPKTLKAFVAAAASTVPGRPAALTVRRGDKTFSVTLTPQAMTEMPAE